MARWRLTASHYLKIEGTKWEYSETDRMTGKARRIQFAVPTLLDVDDPTSWNHDIIRNPRGEILGGNIIVAWADGVHDPKDFIFVGAPTPEMEPLDEEAVEISAQLRETWKRPPEAEGGSFGDALIQAFQQKFQAAESAPAKIDGMSEVLTAMTSMMKQNQEIMMLLMGQRMGLAQEVDTEAPLPDVMPSAAEIAASEKKAASRRA